MQILVVGMHRSGTSMVTRVLNLMGAYFGTENDGTGIVNQENPKGFWERRDVRAINERILAEMGADWDRVTPWVGRPSTGELPPRDEKELLGVISKLEPHRPWVIKDPRLCLTLAAWLPRLEMAQVVMPLRHPIEVAVSLQNRNGFPLDVGLALWEAYSLEAVRALGDHQVHLVRYEALIESPVHVARNLHRTLTESGVARLSLANEEELMAFVDPSLYRSRLPEVGRHYHEHPAVVLYGELCGTEAQPLSRFARELSTRSAKELAAHELRSKKVKTPASAAWTDLAGRLVQLVAASPQPGSAVASTVDRVEDEIALATGRAAERCRQLRAEIGRLQDQHQRDEERKGRDEQQLRKLELQLSEADARLQQESARVADLEARSESLDTAMMARADELEIVIGRETQLQKLVAEQRESLQRAESAASIQEQDIENLRLQLLVALGQDGDGDKGSLQDAIHRVAQRLALQSAVSEQVRQTKKAEAQLRALVRQVRGLRQSARGVIGDYGAASRAQRRVRENLGVLHASRSWQTGDRMMRLAERAIGRESVWTAGHGKLSRALEQLDATLRIGRASATDVARASTVLLNKSKEVASRIEATTTALNQLSATELFARHIALIEGGSQQHLRKLRAADDQDASIRARLFAERPLVSIIMPSYNRAALIGEAIGTVLEQTYPHWELLVCDDGSTDDTSMRVSQLGDPRIRLLALEHGGAAAARNSGLAQAGGRYVAYLDSDNLWHPSFLLQVVGALVNSPGRLSAYSDYLDVDCKGGRYRLRQNRVKPFSYEGLAERNYIDLNAFVHDAALLRVVDGFTRSLSRQQDWDLVLKIAYMRDPLMVDIPLMLYRRNTAWKQITVERKNDTARSSAQVRSNVASYYSGGLSRRRWKSPKPKLTVLSWDICRNHFSKAYNIAEAAQQSFNPQLIGFRFFGSEVFEPYREEAPAFRTQYFDGAPFPDFFTSLTNAWARVDGKAIYCVKPRLASLGVALLANYHRGTPIILESNDSEAHVSDPQRRNGEAMGVSLADCPLEDLLNPYADAWSQVMDGYAREVPLIVTHNQNLDAHYGGSGYVMRNLKDEGHYDPERYDREEIRRELGFGPTDRVILFGGLLRKHKGIYELVKLVRSLGDPRYKLLFVGSRVSPDQERLVRDHADEIKILPPQGRNQMAKINLAADLVVLWLDPEIPASHYQMPYKFTDAIAMHVPVIANDISDLGLLGRQGYLRLVDFGDFEALREAVRATFNTPVQSAAMAASARQLYLRQFSYAAANTTLKVLYEHARAQRGVLPVAERFARDFSGFCERVRRAQAVSSGVSSRESSA